MDAVVLPPHLTEDEINDLCKPLIQPAAQVRFLRDKLHLQVDRKPGGQPLVWRTNLEAVKGQTAPTGKSKPSMGAEPDMAAALALLSQRKGRNGSQTRR